MYVIIYFVLFVCIFLWHIIGKKPSLIQDTSSTETIRVIINIFVTQRTNKPVFPCTDIYDFLVLVSFPSQGEVHLPMLQEVLEMFPRSSDVFVVPKQILAHML
jgi:hypothetical protein